MSNLLTYNELTNLLKELNDILAKKELAVTLQVYGGYVMCAQGIRTSTEDIDAIYLEAEVEVNKAVVEVAKNNNVSSNWLNSAIKEIVTDDMINEEYYTYFQLSHFMVNFPTEEQLLAMKLYSARVSKDLSDAIELSRRLNIANEQQLDNILKKFFSLERIRDRNKNNKNIIGRFKRAIINEL